MATKKQLQTSMDETRIDDTELEQLLEDREELKENVSKYRKADKEVKAKINTIEAPSPFRIGRFVITRTPTPPRSVSFETDGGLKINIKLLGE